MNLFRSAREISVRDKTMPPKKKRAAAANAAPASSAKKGKAPDAKAKSSFELKMGKVDDA